jgi:hypothetical protein
MPHRWLKPQLLTPCRDSSGFNSALRTSSARTPLERQSALVASAGGSRRHDGCNALPYTELGGVRSREMETKVAGTNV